MDMMQAMEMGKEILMAVGGVVVAASALCKAMKLVADMLYKVAVWTTFKWDDKMMTAVGRGLAKMGASLDWMHKMLDKMPMVRMKAKP